MTKNLQLTEKQAELIKAVQSRKYKFLLWGASMGCGKTYLGAILFLQMALNYPETRYAVLRKHLTVLKRTTLQTFLKVAQDLGIPYSLNRADLYMDIGNSRIYFIEADESKDPDFNKLKGLELTAAMMDEANEMVEGAFNILMARIGRENPNGIQSFILLTCNPAQNWVKERFYTPWINGELKAPYYFLPALATDNPFLSGDYLATLELLPEVEYQRYVLGNWDFADDPNQLIKYEWIKSNIWTPEGEPTALGVDVAREGDDRTVFAYSNKDGLHNLEIFKHQDTMTTAQLAIERMKEKRIGYKNVGVDVVGVGGGVVDAMREQGYYIIDFNSGSSPTKMAGHLLFKNLRAESYWDLREALQKGEWKLSDNRELIQELLAIRYKVTDKIIQIESKAEMKKRIGHSPDLADAVVISKYCNRGKPEILVGVF